MSSPSSSWWCRHRNWPSCGRCHRSQEVIYLLGQYCTLSVQSQSLRKQRRRDTNMHGIKRVAGHWRFGSCGVAASAYVLENNQRRSTCTAHQAKQLHHIVVIHRHGDRAPVTRSIGPKYPHSLEVSFPLYLPHTISHPLKWHIYLHLDTISSTIHPNKYRCKIFGKKSFYQVIT